MKKNITLSLLVFCCGVLHTVAHSKTCDSSNIIGISTVAGAAFERVDLHGDILKRSYFVPPFEWKNTLSGGGTGVTEAAVLSGGSSGSSQLILKKTTGFGADQLITYKGVNKQYYTVAISRISDSKVVLKSPLEVPIASPQKIWNFYADPDHPNEHGYKAIADYSVRNLHDLNKGKHVLFGDSWFDHYPKHFSIRLANKLPNATIINSGKGGNTTQNLLDRFDSGVTKNQPDVVWIMAGNNDYNHSVSKETYLRNTQELIRKINKLGARAIVFNASVGKPLAYTKVGDTHLTVSYELTKRSHDYYIGLEALLCRK